MRSSLAAEFRPSIWGAAWFCTALGFVAASLLPGLALAAQNKEVIAVESAGLPGALVCLNSQSLQFAIQRQGPRSGFEPFFLPPRCTLIRAGTVMTNAGLDWRGFPIVAVIAADGRSIIRESESLRSTATPLASAFAATCAGLSEASARFASAGTGFSTDAARDGARCCFGCDNGGDLPSPGVFARAVDDVAGGHSHPGGDRESKHSRV